MRIRLAILVLCLSQAPLHAQDVVQLTPATRLRVSAASPVTLGAARTYRALTDTALVLSRDTSQSTIPLADITRVELSGGRKPNVAAGVVGFPPGCRRG